MKILVERSYGNWRFWIMHSNGTEIARSVQTHRTQAKAIAAAQKIATAFRKGDVPMTVDGETVTDVNQWGD